MVSMRNRVNQYVDAILEDREILWDCTDIALAILGNEPELVYIDSAACEEMYDCVSHVHTELCHQINHFNQEGV